MTNGTLLLGLDQMRTTGREDLVNVTEMCWIKRNPIIIYDAMRYKRI